MSKVCAICGKKPVFGHRISHAHNVTRRRFFPNLQRIRVNVNGVNRRMVVCTRCIRGGMVAKAT